jgi:hypothetical protein
MRRAIAVASIALSLAACGGGGDDDSADTSSAPPTATASGSAATQPTDNAPTAATDATPATDSSPTAASAATPANSGDSGSEGDPGDVHAPLAVGSTAQTTANDVGTVKATIEQITDPATSTSSFYQPAAGNRLWAAQVTVETHGDATDQDSFGVTLLWTLHTTDGLEYEQVFSSGVGEQDLVVLGVTDAQTLQGSVAFEIPEGATVEWVKMDTSIYVGYDIYFDA